MTGNTPTLWLWSRVRTSRHVSMHADCDVMVLRLHPADGVSVVSTKGRVVSQSNQNSALHQLRHISISALQNHAETKNTHMR
jgi:hypothetical protein